MERQHVACRRLVCHCSVKLYVSVCVCLFSVRVEEGGSPRKNRSIVVAVAASKMSTLQDRGKEKTSQEEGNH